MEVLSVGEIGTVNQILSEKFMKILVFFVENTPYFSISSGRRQVGQNQGKMDGRSYHLWSCVGCGREF